MYGLVYLSLLAGVAAEPESQPATPVLSPWLVQLARPLTEEDCRNLVERIAKTQRKGMPRQYLLSAEQQVAVNAIIERRAKESIVYLGRHREEINKVSQQLASAKFNSPEWRGYFDARMSILQGMPVSLRQLVPAVEGILPREQVKSFQATRGGVSKEPEKWVPPVDVVDAYEYTDNWAKYADLFIRVFSLDSTQAETARSILKEVQERRGVYQKKRGRELAELYKEKDSKKQTAKRAELMAPIKSLFEELKVRLDQIPTTEQRNKAWRLDRSPTSRSATRPGVETH
jgi:hypothetical protein